MPNVQEFCARQMVMGDSSPRTWCAKGASLGRSAKKIHKEAPDFWVFFDFMLCKVLDSCKSILSFIRRSEQEIELCILAIASEIKAMTCHTLQNCKEKKFSRWSS